MPDQYSVTATLSATDKNFSSTMNKAKKSVEDLSQTSNKTEKSFGSMFGASMLGNIAANVIQTAGNAMTGFAGEAVRASDSMDKFKSTMGFAGKTGEEVSKASAFVKQYADDTVYELSDVANTTAQLAANGIGNYTELTQAAGNLNAVAGGNANTFKSVAMMLTQTAGAGKLTTENWNQLADAIPGASGKLQEAMKQNGAYTGNFRDAMAKGEITADEFNQAILQLGMTEVAQEAATSTKTIEGALGNLAANATTKITELIDKIGKDNITNAISGLSDIIGSVLDKIGQVASFIVSNWGTIGPIVAGVTGAFVAFKAVAVFTSIISGIKGLVSGLTLAGAGAKLFGAAMTFLGGPIGLIAIAIGAIVGVILYLWNTNEGFRNAVISIWESIKSAFTTAWETIKTAWSTAGAFFTQLWESIKQGAQTFVTWISGIWEGIKTTVSTVVTAIVTFFKNLWTQAQTIWQGIVNSITTILNTFAPIFQAVWDGIKLIAETVWNAIKATIEVVINVIKGIITAIMQAINGDWSGAWNTIKTTLSTAWEAMKQIVTNVINVIKGVITNVWNAIKTTITNVMNNIKTNIQNAWNSIKSAVSNALNSIKSTAVNAWNSIKSTISNAMNSVKSTITNAWNAVKSAVSNAMSNLKSTVTNGWNSIKSFLSGINLADIGRRIIQSLIDGVKGMIGALKGVFNSITSMIPDWKGPYRVDKVLLTPAGEAIMKSLVGGLDNRTRHLKDFLTGTTDMIANSMNGMSFSNLSSDFENMNISRQQSLQSTINEEVTIQKQPANIQFRLGKQTFRTFVEDINDSNSEYNELERIYAL